MSSAQCYCPTVVGMKGSRSQQISPANSGSSDSSLGSHGSSSNELSEEGESSVGADLHFPSPRPLSQPVRDAVLSGASTTKPGMSTSSGSGGGISTDLASIVVSADSEHHHTDTTVFLTSHDECSSPKYGDLKLSSAAIRHPLILHHPQMVEGVEPVGDESTTSWLYDFYPNVLGTSPKDDLESYVEQSTMVHKVLGPPLQLDVVQPQPQLLAKDQEDPVQSYSRHTVFRSQEKYVVTLRAPISIAQHRNDDTLTYLNKGQFYNICVSSNPRLSRPQRVKTILALTFFDESDRKLELNHWQYWHNLQANPNQKAFDIDRKNCENIIGKCEDLSYNASSFIWSTEVGAEIVMRINCLSTEFSSQKGVKGLPLYLVTDTYEDVDSVGAEPVHRGFCRIKIFRDKGAERKNKDETRTVERRMQKFKKQPGSSQDSEPAMFHLPSKETVFTSTSTLGPKPFLFTPMFNSPAALEIKEPSFIKADPEVPASNFLANIKDRVNKRSFSKALKEAKEDFGALEVEEGIEETPPKKAPRIPSHSAITVYVRKNEESIYKALVLDTLSIQEFKTQVARKYDVPEDMIKDIYKRTKRGLLVHFDDDMISRFQDEDDFVIDLTFDNQKGYFDLFIHY